MVNSNGSHMEIRVDTNENRIIVFNARQKYIFYFVNLQGFTFRMKWIIVSFDVAHDFLKEATARVKSFQ